MGSAPLVSIIITCYNQGQYLHDALNSVLMQSYTKWECIIVNDGSFDNTQEVALRWCAKDVRFAYLFQENRGVAEARNLAITKSTGKYIQFLDADDVLVRDKLSYQVSILESDNQIGIIYGSSRYFFDQKMEDLFPVHSKGMIPAVDLNKVDRHQTEVLLSRNVCTICSTLYRREVFDKIRFRNVIFEDWIFHIECSLDNFIFHFDNSIKSYSLIRMTDQSQMMAHIYDAKGQEEFRNLVSLLILERGFKSQLVDNSSELKNERSVKSVSSLFKYYFKEFIPPIFLTCLKKLSSFFS